MRRSSLMSLLSTFSTRWKVFETSLSAKGEYKTLCLDQVCTGVVGLMPVFQMLSKFLQRCKR